jgi:PAS domain S-box-containing protein
MLADESPLPVWVVDRDGGLLLVNRAYREFCGCGEADVLGAAWHALVHPDDRQGVVNELLAALRDRRGFAGEARVRHATGEWRRVEAHATPRLSASGEFLGLVGSSAEITAAGPTVDEAGRAAGEAAIKKAHEGLRASEGRLRAMFEGHLAPMLLIEPESGRILDANAAAADFYGYARDELRAMCIEQINLLSPDEVAAQRHKAADRATNMFVFPHRLAGGEVRFVEVYSSPVTIDGRQMLFSIIHDVTARRRAEEALRESEEAFRVMFDQSRVGKVQVDPASGHFLRANEAFCRLTGYSEEDLLGRTFFAITHPDDRAEDAAKLEALREGRIEWFESEKRYVRPDGRVVWALVSVNLARDAAGRVRSTVGVVQDITARKEAEAALRESEAERAAHLERARLARDLHDSVSQAVFAAALKAEALDIAAECGDDRIGSAASQVCRLCKGALADLRAMLLELRGERLEDVPINQLLRQLVEATEGRTSARVRLSIEGSSTLPADMHVAVYRIAQEALNNVARHARAEHAWVEMESAGTSGSLLVRDDGRGFEPREFGADHLGIRMMRERAAEVGADLELTSAKGRGASVVLRWER